MRTKGKCEKCGAPWGAHSPGNQFYGPTVSHYCARTGYREVKYANEVEGGEEFMRQCSSISSANAARYRK